MKKVLLLFFALLTACFANAQDVKTKLEKASALMGEENYNEAYSILQNSTDKQAEEISDTCLAYFNYYKGTCLYYLKKYQEAIPCLQKGIQTMDKLHYKNCDYLEMMYGIGSSYKELGDYSKAEEYYRRTILRGNDLLNCAIRNQTYSEMADLYNLMGKPDLADICTSRIESEMRLSGEKNFKSQLDALWDIYKAYDNQGKLDESLNTLRKILRVVEDNMGKNNEDYLLYSSLLGALLKNNSHAKEAASIHKEIIEIGKQFRTYREDVCFAYEDYLQYLSEKGDVDSVELILPSAVRYISSTKQRRHSKNLYETIGLGLFDADKYEEGVKYLERKWNGESANSIKALNYLGLYYMYNKDMPDKALTYYNNAQKQIEGGLEVPFESKITILENLILCHQRLGNTENAKSLYALLKPLIQNDPNYYSRFLIQWSNECLRAGSINIVEELLSESKSLLDDVSGETKIRLYSNLGFVYIKIEKPDSAIPFILKGIDLAIKEEGEKSKYLSTMYHNLGRAYMLENDYSNALNALYKSRDLQNELEGGVMQRTNDYIKECESK